MIGALDGMTPSRMRDDRSTRDTNHSAHRPHKANGLQNTPLRPPRAELVPGAAKGGGDDEAERPHKPVDGPNVDLALNVNVGVLHPARSKRRDVGTD